MYARRLKPCPYYTSAPMHNPMNNFGIYPNTYWENIPWYNQDFSNHFIGPYYPLHGEIQQPMYIDIKDYGPEPFAVNIEAAARQNNTFRTALWTGKHLQITLMSLNVGEDIGLEVQPDLDQFIRIEQGQGLVMMGDNRNNLDYQSVVMDDYAFVIPAGTWHNLINTGSMPLKLYSIYAPPQHPHGTVHATKEDAMAAEHNH
jgi:mannose-6-phosphate isomerase-like protein (cupin superfamily)